MSAIEIKRMKWTPRAGVMSEYQLGKLYEGYVAYIKVLTPAEAHTTYPGISDLPRDGVIYVLTHADGTPIAITNTLPAALGHAIEDELEIARIH